MAKEVNSHPKRFFSDPNDFDEFTYSKSTHLTLFTQNQYDQILFNDSLNENSWSLKHYQDLLVFSFIKQFVPQGSRMLEIGGGKSRIIEGPRWR